MLYPSICMHVSACGTLRYSFCVKVHFSATVMARLMVLFQLLLKRRASETSHLYLTVT